MLKLIARVWYALSGWRSEGNLPPDVRKCVLIAAPHTSNWDFPITVAALALMGQRGNYLTKKELFKFPLGGLLRALGGVPVDRSRKKGRMVDRMAEVFAEHDYLVLLVPPEGTRGYVKAWKTGFYYTAVKAGVPIALGYLDYGRKVAGIGPLFYPTGDYEKDLPEIQKFYLDKTPKYPKDWSLPDIYGKPLPEPERPSPKQS